MKSNSIYRIFTILLFTLNRHVIQAGPIIRREIYPEVEQDIPESRNNQPQVCIVGDVVYGIGEAVPSEQPCLKCSCSPPDVRCETEICVPQPGCKAIHRPNKCCPDYQCECSHEGKVYANGERLPMAPGGECWVCYCRGGEVQCAEVGCYTRSDCKPKYVTGQCCPKYDHCPPRDPLSDRIQYTTESQLSSIDDQITTFTNPSSNATKLYSQLTSTDSSEEGSGDIFSSQSSIEDVLITSPRPQTVIIEESKIRPATPVTFSIKEIELKTQNNKRNDVPAIKIDKASQTDFDGRPQITIQEVIPPRSEFKPPIVPSVHAEVVSLSPINPVTYKIETSTNNAPYKTITETSNDLSDNESYASEKTEVYDHPPPVLRIGDQILFIKQGQLVPEKDASTPTPIITLIGAEGLQIGLESGEIEQEIIFNKGITSANPTNSTSTKKDENTSTTTQNAEKTPKDYQSVEAISGTETNIKFVSAEDNEASLKEIETNQPDNSGEYIFVSSSVSPPNTSETSSEISSSTSSSTSNQTEEEIKNDENSSVSNLNKETVAPSEYIPEENPYYPPIPEDIMNLDQEEITTEHRPQSSNSETVSLNDYNTINYTDISETSSLNPSSNKEETSTTPSIQSTANPEEISVIPLQSMSSSEIEIKSNATKETDSKILPEVLEIIVNSTSAPNTSENGTAPSLEWLKKNNGPTKLSIPLINENAAIPDSILLLPAASDTPSAEDTDDDKTTMIIEENEPKIIEVTPSKISLDKKEEKMPEIHEEVTKAEKIIVVEPPQSKETIELNDETFDSGESTTSNTFHSSLMSNEDASVEVINNNSSPEQSSEVEMMPGFEKPTEKSITKNIPIDEKMIQTSHNSNEDKDNKYSPKNDVEMITMNTDKVVNEEKSHAELQNNHFHDEIQKRDVVKKVLKDVFDNPKENIRTDDIGYADPDTATDYPDYSLQSNEELNVVQPNDNLLAINRNTPSNNTKIIIHKETTDKQIILEKENTVKQENVQKVNNEKNSQEKSDGLSATTLSVLRDFFKTQFKQMN